MQPQSVSVGIRTTEHDDTASLPAQAGWKKNEESINVADNDPFMAYALSHPSTIQVDHLQLDSPVLQILKTNGVEIALPLVSQGELIGLLILEPRLNGE